MSDLLDQYRNFCFQLAGLDINQDSARGRVGAYVPPHRRDADGTSESGRSDSGRRSKNSEYRHDDGGNRNR